MGIGCFVNLFKQQPMDEKIYNQTDLAALASDFEMIGKDLSTVISNIEKEREDFQKPLLDKDVSHN